MKADLKVADGTGTFNPLKRVVQWIDERVSMVRRMPVYGLTSAVQWIDVHVSIRDAHGG